jgi:hypothetical protein
MHRYEEKEKRSNSSLRFWQLHTHTWSERTRLAHEYVSTYVYAQLFPLSHTAICSLGHEEYLSEFVEYVPI